MTHKNPELRAGSVVKAKESSPKPKSTPTYGKTVSEEYDLENSLKLLFVSFLMPDNYKCLLI